MLSRPRSGTGPEGFFTTGRYGFNMLLRRYDAAEQVLLEDPAEIIIAGDSGRFRKRSCGARL